MTQQMQIDFIKLRIEEDLSNVSKRMIWLAENDKEKELEYADIRKTIKVIIEKL